MRWSKRGYVSIVETLISNAAIGCSQWPKSRANSKSLLEGYSEFEDLKMFFDDFLMK